MHRCAPTAAQVQTSGPAKFVSKPGVASWRSPRTGAVYPVAPGGFTIGELVFETQPLMNDQELDSRASAGAVYWEGASELLQSGRRVGRGYLGGGLRRPDEAVIGREPRRCRRERATIRGRIAGDPWERRCIGPR